MRLDIFRKWIGHVPDVVFLNEKIEEAVAKEDGEFLVIVDCDSEYLEFALIAPDDLNKPRDSRTWNQINNFICKKSDVFINGFYVPEDEEIPKEFLAQFKPSTNSTEN